MDEKTGIGAEPRRSAQLLFQQAGDELNQAASGIHQAQQAGQQQSGRIEVVAKHDMAFLTRLLPAVRGRFLRLVATLIGHVKLYAVFRPQLGGNANAYASLVVYPAAWSAACLKTSSTVSNRGSIWS